MLFRQAKTQTLLLSGDCLRDSRNLKKKKEERNAGKSTEGKFRGSEVACRVLPYWEQGININTTKHNTWSCLSLFYVKRHPATQLRKHHQLYYLIITRPSFAPAFM